MGVGPLEQADGLQLCMLPFLCMCFAENVEKELIISGGSQGRTCGGHCACLGAQGPYSDSEVAAFQIWMAQTCSKFRVHPREPSSSDSYGEDTPDFT